MLRYEDAPEPVCGPGQVRIAVQACALNHLDIWNRKGLPGRPIPFPHIAGADVAGTVLEAGAGVNGVHVGQKVVVSPGLSCGRCAACLSGRDHFCPDYDVLGSRSDGGYAQQVVVPAVNILPHPRGLSAVEAAAFPLVFLTAWNMLVTLAQVRPGETALVLGAGSGVGHAAVQIAKLHGARVIATAGSQPKLERARSLGADWTINHKSQNVQDEVRRLTDRAGVDIVFEHTGQATWGASLRSLKPGGRLVTCGATTGYQAETDLRFIFSRQLRIFGAYMGSKADLLEVWKFIDAGRLRPVVDRTFALREAAEAHRYLEEGKHFGKVVLEVP